MEFNLQPCIQLLAHNLLCFPELGHQASVLQLAFVSSKILRVA